MKILFGYLLTYIYIFGILFLVNILKKKRSLTDETSRKCVHVLVAFSWIIMYIFFGNTWHLLIPPITFVILNYISYKKDTFSMMERKDKTVNSLGTVYYPVSMVILSIVSIMNCDFIAPYGIGMFSMALGDGLAPYFGQKFKTLGFSIGNNKKTVLGSFVVFISTLIVAIIFNISFGLLVSVVDILIIAFSAIALEAIGVKGIDNLTLPIGVSIISYFLILV